MLRGGGRSQSVTVPAGDRIDGRLLEEHLTSLGEAGTIARRLDRAADARWRRVQGLSPLSDQLAEAYVERIGRPIPSLEPPTGAEIVARTYVAHMELESDAGGYGAPDVPVLANLPAPRNGRLPGDLLVRLVKASRRRFDLVCALSPPAWDGFCWCLTRRAHDAVRGEPSRLVPLATVEGLARFAWVLRQADIHYGLAPDVS